jgi:GNAT superfamily N-acetyltransferase
MWTDYIRSTRPAQGRNNTMEMADMVETMETTVNEWSCGEYTISTDKERLDLKAVHGFLSRGSYWARGIPLETVVRSVEHSLSFGVYNAHQQVGFARVITDYATFGYIADVFILTPFRGQGLGKWLMRTILSHPELQGLRSWMLATRDAHELYRKVGFDALPNPERWMARRRVTSYGSHGDEGRSSEEEKRSHERRTG